MVNSKNPNKLIKNPTLPPGIQDSSKGIGESPDSLNLLSRASSRAGKRVHSRGRPQTRRIARRSSRSVSASSASRNPSPEALSSSSSGESEEESVGSDPKTPTAPRVITGKLSFKKLPPLKLPAAFPEGKASTMSWDDQVAAEEGNNMVSGAENVPKSAQVHQAPMLGPLNMIHGSAESSSHLGNQNIAHNNELWDGEHHALSLSGYSGHLETDTKMLSTSLKRLTGFIKQHPLGGRPIEQFPTILGVGSYVWNLLQAISESGWDRFKVSPQTNAPTLVEAMRTVYGPNPISTPSPDVEMDVDAPEAEEVAFTLVTNKKGGKGKAKASSPPPTNSRNKIPLVSRAPPAPKAVTASAASKPAATCPSSAAAATTTSKPAQPQNGPPPVPLASKPKPKAKSFAQAAKANISGPKFAPASSHEDFLRLLQLKEAFPNLPQATIISMHQASLGVARASQGSPSRPSVSRTLKMTTQGPTRRQVLIPLAPAAAEVVVANAASAVESCNKGLVSARSKLRVESVRKAWDGVSMSTNSVASVAELEVIKQWLKKTAGLGEITEVEPRLPQSKSFLKVLGVPYWDSKTSLPVTPAQVAEALSSSPLFEGVTLASMPRIMKASPSSDMSVIWIDIWDSQKGSKGKTLINRSFNFGRHTATVRGTAMHPGVAQCRNCWRWGHPTHACRAQGAKCQKCGGPHRVENHRLLAWCCKANPKSNPPREATAAGVPCPHTFKCLNCKGDHTADDNKCPFWRHRFDKQWHANKAAEVRSGRANHSTVNGPSGGSQ